MASIGQGVSSRIFAHVAKASLREGRVGWLFVFRTFFKGRLFGWLLVGEYQLRGEQQGRYSAICCVSLLRTFCEDGLVGLLVRSRVSAHVTKAAFREDLVGWLAGFRTFYEVRLVCGGWLVSIGRGARSKVAARVKKTGVRKGRVGWMAGFRTF